MAEARRSQVRTLGAREWILAPEGTPPLTSVASALEAGDVLFLPNLSFAIEPSERHLLSPATLAGKKNVSFDPGSGRLSGTRLEGPTAGGLRDLVSRFSRLASGFASELLPAYQGRLELGRASFRPVEIAGRPTSWRQDDTRLHIDSFAATPVHGKRILRVFTNINPDGRPRTWRIGEDFDNVVRRFARELRMPWPGSAAVRRLFRITKSTRSAYDALMLQLHDRMKADSDYQANAPQTRVEFPPGSSWIAFTDQVSHAAMAGQFQLEQTLLLPVDAILDEQRSPLRVLERFLGRPLV